MNTIQFPKAVISGILGTGAFTVFTQLQSFIGFPQGDIPMMLSSFLGAPLFIGWLMHFGIGIALAIIYAFLSNKLPFCGWKQGAFYGIFPWLMAMFLVMPMMGMPVFTGSFLMATASLIGHIIYGASVGYVYIGQEACSISNE
ncbi:MAG: DUF1440 domain-containing protein [Deltaproteobacteria bacterium]|nr:DUF1440 domain-containing protein [Deltaproteobacteria bacterium]